MDTSTRTHAGEEAPHREQAAGSARRCGRARSQLRLLAHAPLLQQLRGNTLPVSVLCLQLLCGLVGVRSSSPSRASVCKLAKMSQAVQSCAWTAKQSGSSTSSALCACSVTLSRSDLRTASVRVWVKRGSTSRCLPARTFFQFTSKLSGPISTYTRRPGPKCASANAACSRRLSGCSASGALAGAGAVVAAANASAARAACDGEMSSGTMRLLGSFAFCAMPHFRRTALYGYYRTSV